MLSVSLADRPSTVEYHSRPQLAAISQDPWFSRVQHPEFADYAAFDRIVPHPVYAKQLWISILNPTDETFRDVILPLLDEAHERVATVRARHAAAE